MVSPDLDIDRLRSQTPAVADRVLLNHAGASPSPEPVLDVVIDHLREEARVGGYEAAAARTDDIAAVHGSVAELLACDPTEVAVTTSATDAWETAFWSLRWAPGDVVLTCRSEYVTNVVNLLVARDRFGVDVRVVADDDHGRIDLGDLDRHLADPAVRLVALSHVPTQGGLVNPAAEVGALTRAAGVPFLLDACQSAGHLPLDVGAIGCDLLSATGRKYLRAPRGTGFLMCRTELAERLEPLGSGGAEWISADAYAFPSRAARFERFEHSVAGLLGLGAAVDYALSIGLEVISERIRSLADRLRSGLGDRPGVVVRDLGVQRCGIVTFTVAGTEASAVRRDLAEADVHVWTTGAEVARIDLGSRGLDAMVRASVHYLNTPDEIDRTVSLVGRIAERSA